MGYVKIRAVRVVQNITENLAMKSNSNLSFPNTKLWPVLQKDLRIFLIVLTLKSYQSYTNKEKEKKMLKWHGKRLEKKKHKTRAVRLFPFFPCYCPSFPR